MAKKPLKCPVCAKGFKSIDAVRSHGATSRHDTSRLVVPRCASCGKEFATPAALLSHSQHKRHGQYGSISHMSQGTVSAAASGPTSTPAATTIPTSTPSALPYEFLHEAPAWICSICNIAFPGEVERNAHYRASSVHPSCGQCGQGCKTKLDLIQHHQVTHGAHVCPCGAVVKFSEKQEHYTASPRHPKCPKCGGGFKDVGELVEHINKTHASVGQSGGASDKGKSREEPFPTETHPTPSQNSTTRVTPPSADAGPPVIPNPILIEQQEVASEDKAAVKSEAKPDDSIDTVTPITLEVKIVPNETIEIEQPAGSPVEGAVATVHLATTLSEDFEILEDISREDPEAVDVVAQVGSQLNEPPTASVASFGPGISSDAEITSVASSEIVSVVSLEDLPQTTQVIIPSYSAKDSMRGSGEGSSSAPESEQLSHSPPVEPEPRTVLPHSDACTRGSTRVPSPFPCALSSDLNRLGSPPPSPPMMDASEVSSTFADRATMSMHRVSSYLGNTRLGAPTTGRRPTESIPQPQPAGPLPRAPPAGPSWHCRSCGKDPCDNPTATVCGHIFCHQCIVKEIAETMQCPVCRNMFLLKLHVD